MFTDSTLVTFFQEARKKVTRLSTTHIKNDTVALPRFVPHDEL